MIAVLYRRLDDRPFMLKIEQIFVWVFMSVILSLLLVGGYWLFIDNEVPVTRMSALLTDPNGVPRTVFKRGDTLLITREQCYTQDGAYIFSRYFVNKANKLTYIMPTGTSIIEAGCRKSVNTVIIPKYMSPGDYEYRVAVHYENNPFIDGIVQLPIVELTVVD